MVIGIFFQILLGGTLLYLGGDALVRGAQGLARLLGLSELLIGLTVVALGTSSPELFVSLKAAWQGVDSIVLGNILGSNIVNIGLILGLVLLLGPRDLNLGSVRFDTFYTVLVYLFLASISYSFAFGSSFVTLGAFEGLILLGFFIPYFFWHYHHSSPSSSDETKDTKGMKETSQQFPIVRDFLAIMLGLFALYWGSEWFVLGAQSLALNILHIDESLIALTLVALGTSLPELVSSLIALRKGSGQLAIGNAVGSSLLNVLVILSVTVLLKVQKVEYIFIRDFIVMSFLALVLFLFTFLPKRFSRLWGLFFLAVYALYTIYIFIYP